MSTDKGFSVRLELLENYIFKVDFGEFGDIITDEAPPLGSGEGPNPSGLVAAAVGNCLCASLLFALRKYKDNPAGIRAEVKGEMERQDGRWRIARMHVRMQLEDTQLLEHLPKALEQFEDFCIVTQSIRKGIPVSVDVVDQKGNALKR